MPSISAWLVTFRLRTLPLSLSTIILGSFLAAFRGNFQWGVLVWAVLTTLFLQILSNLANDYGDALHGVDNTERVGPKRSLQAGSITMKQMRLAVGLFIGLSLISGIMLLLVGTKGLTLNSGLIMLLLGIAAIIAALKYTVGKKPYGYAGLGDVSVFIFFGLVGVLGTFYLHTHTLPLLEFLPAASVGFFSAGVLNLNNLRDRDNDQLSGKHTLVVKIGYHAAQIYHLLILSLGMLSAVVYSLLSGAGSQKWIYLLSFIGIMSSIITVLKSQNPHTLDPELKKLSLSTLAFSLLFGLGLIL